MRENLLDTRKDELSKRYGIDFDKLEKEQIKLAKDLFRKYGWPTIDVTRKSVEETAASVIKIYDIMHS